MDPGSELYAELMDRFWRTMVLDDFELVGNRDLGLEDFETMLELMERAIAPDSSFVTERARLDKANLRPRLRPVREISLLVCLDCKIANKVFFLMDNGMFGMTYQGVQDQDVLCVFDSAKLPHLLRWRDENSWTFVGEAYVHTLMHGEAENTLDPDGKRVESQTFLLV